MDTDMEDVGRAPEPSRLSPVTEPATIPTLDGWIESLMTCKQLAESDVQRLCEKVCARGEISIGEGGDVRGDGTWAVRCGWRVLTTRFPGTRGLAGRVECATGGKQ